MDGPVPHFAQFVHQFLSFLDFLLVKDGRQFLEAVFRIPVQLFYRLDLFLALPDDMTLPAEIPAFVVLSARPLTVLTTSG